MTFIEGKEISVPLKNLPINVRPLRMVWISAGTFTMGSLEDEPNRTLEDIDQGYFEMTFSRGFWLGQYSATQAQWQAVMSDNPSHYQPCPDCPVETINWHQAMAFCAELNEQFDQILPTNYKFSLPTEAQWEYSCRAGTQTLYHSGNSLADLSRVAWHKENSGGHPQPVGQKEPNAWGLYDMHGNVDEWCYDATSSYPKIPAIDWIGKGSGIARSFRGGPWSAPPKSSDFRCSCRAWLGPERSSRYLGFRLCLRIVDSKT
jgi:formylglycine-generating enzyme required for sulfatase activity